MLPSIAIADEALAKRVTAFTAIAKINYLSCASKAQTEGLSAQLMRQPIDTTEINTCVAKAKEERAKEFSNHKQTLAKNRDASVALKDHYAFWLASMDAIHAALRNSEMNARAAKLDELANRLTVEIQ